MAQPKPTDVERIKEASGHLRGTLAQSLVDPLTGGIAEDDTQLSKFHGIYQQDDRDLRSERTRQRLEPAFSFMIRARVPAGILTTEQWQSLDDVATQYANDSIRLTTRQAESTGCDSQLVGSLPTSGSQPSTMSTAHKIA